MRGSLETRADEYRNTVLQRDPLIYNLFLDGYDLDISLRPGSEPARYKALLMRRVKEPILHLADRHKVLCIFLIIPSPIDAADWEIAVDPKAYPEYNRSRLTDVLEAIATDDHVAHVNLFKPLYEDGGEDLHYHTDDHRNPREQQLATNLMARYIAAQRLDGSSAMRTDLAIRKFGALDVRG